VEAHGRRLALLVDELLGQQQVVIKPLSGALAKTPGVSGGAVLGDGRVGLILDAAGLIRLYTGEEAPADGIDDTSSETGN
jgi:two-component system chemotaxis sensor kinase CheA